MSLSTGRRSRRLQTGRSTGRQIMNQSVSPAAYDRNTRTQRWKSGREWVPADPVKIIDTERRWVKPGLETSYPLRTMLMDKNNPLPPHRTQVDLQKSLSHLNRAHSSYDLDGDGVVSLTDYKIARGIDTDNSGIIDEDEHMIGKEKLSRQFYEEANEFTERGKLNHHEIKKKAHELALHNDKQFGRTYQRLKQKLWIKESRGGMNVIQCLNFPKQDQKARFMHKKIPDYRVVSARTQKLRKCTSVDELKISRKRDFHEYEENKRLENSGIDRYRYPTGRRYSQQSFLGNLTRFNGLQMLKYTQHSTDRIISARLKQKGLF